ncbi:MAG: hypothetical protein ACREP4_06545 [Stenotrophomonas sp.]|uniref:hypothetical protein n=1 Tax=Stenotrophomonas sp. TaxID=69392 RepID=UPI003D6D0568
MSRISADNVEQLREVLADGVLLGASMLLNRLEDKGVPRFKGHALVTKAAALGLIKRLGLGTPYRYQLCENWTPPPAGVGRDTYQQAASQQYQGPAFGPAQLIPSVGLVCGSAEEEEGELPPMIGARIAESIHRNFDEIFQRCE